MKTSELSPKNNTELQQELESLLRAHFNMRMQHGTQQLTNTAQLGHVRSDIARVRTLLRQRTSA